MKNCIHAIHAWRGSGDCPYCVAEIEESRECASSVTKPEPSSSDSPTLPEPAPTSSSDALLERQCKAIERLCDLLQVVTHQNVLMLEMLMETDDEDEPELERAQYLSQRPGRG